MIKYDNYFVTAPVDEVVVLPKGRRIYILYFWKRVPVRTLVFIHSHKRVMRMADRSRDESCVCHAAICNVVITK